MISVIIPHFNRATLTIRAIKSLESWQSSGLISELILVDDASIEDVSICIKEADFLSDKLNLSTKYLHTGINLGASGAKNFGAFHATKEWLLFLDSDDQLAPISDFPVDFLRDCLAQFDLIFCRCRSEATGSLIGKIESVFEFGFDEYNEGIFNFECLPLVRRSKFLRSPYINFLKGGEGLCYLSLLKYGGRGLFIPNPLRIYRDFGQDRLSSKKNLDERRRDILNYHIISLIFLGGARLKVKVFKISKIIYYFSSLYLKPPRRP